MSVKIHSTASQPMTYCIYRENGTSAVLVKKIEIKGTANVADQFGVVAPGCVTEVSDEDYELLKKDDAFNRHVRRGFMKVYDSGSLNTEGMQKRDNSAQLFDEEYAGGKDARVPDSGACQASCGKGDRKRGAKGIAFTE